ncbi:MAG: TIGR04283 family arsenosugar biosynthesis glycosyltransferase [Verrucomicrobiota bacterium]
MNSVLPSNKLPPPAVSVIIPAVNESATLQPILAAIRSRLVTFETIVVDGCSSDQTTAIAQASGARVVSSSCRQRAYQSNLGAHQARGEILLFLHADTVLPDGALDQIVHALQDSHVVGGAFARRYASPSRVLRFTCFLARCRNRLIGWHLGDQAMFVRRAVFFQLGGFREVDLFEDLDFSRRLKKFGRLVTLLPCVISSSRRFMSAGPARTTLRDFFLTVRYLFRGLEPERREIQHTSDLKSPKVSDIHNVGIIPGE